MFQISVDPHVSLIDIFEAGIKVSLGWEFWGTFWDFALMKISF